eukprot:5631208-Amphidinium_carterae.1
MSTYVRIGLPIMKHATQFGSTVHYGLMYVTRFSCALECRDHPACSSIHTSNEDLEELPPGSHKLQLGLRFFGEF